ncbi:hypothetical protein B0H14DRAFT_3446908 [Mycena olivaceomarginata]|nr:hypothetical protein B0H14DRAFT_3446908 [Mycena olivaceomarginata]
MGYHPWKGIENAVESRNEAANNFFEKMKKVRDEATAALEKTQKTMKKYYDEKRRDVPVFKVGNKGHTAVPPATTVSNAHGTAASNGDSDQLQAVFNSRLLSLRELVTAGVVLNVHSFPAKPLLPVNYPVEGVLGSHIGPEFNGHIAYSRM